MAGKNGNDTIGKRTRDLQACSLLLCAFMNSHTFTFNVVLCASLTAESLGAAV
jgi:hypothetical protein